jgi:hypothetical protein
MCGTLLLSLIVIAPTAEPSAAEVQAVKARQAIESCIVEIASKEFDRKTGKVTWESTRKLWLSGDNLRQDVERRPPNISNLGSIKRSLTCYSDGDLIEWREFADPAARVSLEIRKDFAGKEDVGQRPVDPRWLGMAPIHVGNLALYGSIDSLVGNPIRESVTEEKLVWEGKPAVRVRFTHTKKRTANIDIWLVPEWGHSVVRISEADERMERWLESKVALHRPSKLWFPAACTLGTTIAEKTAIEEEAKITLTSLNEPVEAKVFALAGMDLPVDLPVAYVPSPTGRYYWDGKEIVKK